MPPTLSGLETAVRWLLSADGALLGLGFAYLACSSISTLIAFSSSLRQISLAPSVHPSGLHALLTLDENPDRNSDGSSSLLPHSDGGKLVVVRGTVERLRGNDSAIIAQESGRECVIYKRSHCYVSFKWRGVSQYRWTNDLRSIICSTSWGTQEFPCTRTVPFLLAEPGKSDYVVVNMEGSEHQLPLTTVCKRWQPITPTPFTFLQALIGLDFHVAVLDKEKILPVGKEITAIGICSLRDGIPVIKSCKHLPCFLSYLTKAEIVAKLSCCTKELMCSGIICGALAIGILGYSIARNWIRLRERIRQAHQQNDSAANEIEDEAALDEPPEDVPEDQLCMICSTGRHRSAFIPCGHLVSCRRCAFSVRRE